MAWWTWLHPNTELTRLAALPIAALIVTSTLLLAGCVTDLPTRDRTEPRALLMSVEEADRLGFSPAWSTHVLPEPTRYGEVRELTMIRWLDDVIVMVEQPTNRIIAVDARTGLIKFSMPARGAASPVLGVGRAGDNLVFNTQGQLLLAKARTGEVFYRVDLPHTVREPLVMFEDMAILGSVNGRISAIHIPSGMVQWEYRMPVGISAPLVLADDTVIGVDLKGNYAVVGARDGAFRWRARSFAPIVAAPGVDRVGVYVASEDQAMYAADRATGEDRWPAFRAQSPLIDSPVAVGLKVYVPIRQEPALVALDAISGEELWRIQENITPLRLDGDNLLAMRDRRLSVFRAEDGYVVRDGKTQRLQCVVLGPDGSLLLVSRDGRLQRLNPRR